MLAFKASSHLHDLPMTKNITIQRVFSLICMPLLVDILCIILVLFCFRLTVPIGGAPESLQISFNQLKSAFGFSIFLVIFCNFDCLFRRIFSSQYFVYLGRISLGFYLLHQPLMIRSSHFGGLFVGNDYMSTHSIILIFLCSIALAIVFYCLIEVPCMRLFRRLY